MNYGLKQTVFAHTADSKPLAARSCANCTFFDPQGVEVPESISYGMCRRHAPAVNDLPMSASGAVRARGCWPTTYADQWCGEFRQRTHGDIADLTPVTAIAEAA